MEEQVHLMSKKALGESDVVDLGWFINVCPFNVVKYTNYVSGLFTSDVCHW